MQGAVRPWFLGSKPLIVKLQQLSKAPVITAIGLHTSNMEQAKNTNDKAEDQQISTDTGPSEIKTNLLDYKIAYYDLETSGLQPFSAEVIQIAAMIDEETYSCYILPRHIPSIVTRITGLHLKHGLLHLNDNHVETVTRDDAWKGLIEFFQKFKSQIILVGHNIQFDIRMTMPELKYLNLESTFMDIDLNFVCSIPIIKKAYPLQMNYKLTTIADNLNAYDNVFDAHNAVGDVRILRNVMKKLNILDDTLRESSKSLSLHFEKKRKDLEKKNSCITLDTGTGIK